MESEFTKAEKAALRLIARAEQCSTGLARKLEIRGHKPDCVAQVISNLTEQRLIDDSRYARLWLQTRVRLTRTPKRLLAGLCTKGIPREEAQSALNTVLDEEAELALLSRFAKKYAKKAARKNENIITTLKCLLKNEGFSKQAIDNYFNQ